MNNRRRLVVALGVGVLATPLGSLPQPQGKVWRIGFLGRETATGYARELEALRAGLRELGYVEGKNAVIVYRWAEGANERLQPLATELLRENVDILVTHTNVGARAAFRATTTVPIVMASSRVDPVATGLVKSLARPGGNITGLVSFSGVLTLKQLELIRDSLPKAGTVAFMLAPTMEGDMERGLEAAAKALKFDLQLTRVGGTSEIEATIAGMSARRVDALVVSPQPLFVANYARIAAVATHQRIPTLGSLGFADSGGLMGYGANPLHNFRRVAYFIDRIVKGAKPAELPIEQPTKIELVINLKTAEAIGVRIPETVMVRADRVIQ